ncbi:MAG: hypothetical protein EON58_22000, partial [Alphaproteobacteria bacterium]
MHPKDQSSRLDVGEFSEERLREALSSLGVVSPDSAHFVAPNSPRLDSRIGFYKEYLSSRTLRAKWMVVEYGYTDGDYLDDYVGFYSRSHLDYPRKCKRIHFFADFQVDDPTPFDEEKLKSLLSERSASQRVKDFQDKYLGFIIVRP